MSKYSTITIGDLEAIIDRVAMDNLRMPRFDFYKSDGTAYTLAEISNFNSLVAAHNEGVRDLADMLKKELRRYGDPDEA